MMKTKELSPYIKRLQIISQDGLTIYCYPDTFQKNPQLISGMLSAVFLFIKEEYGGSVKSIMLSDRKINFMRYRNYLIILELETYVDDECTEIFFDYFLDLLKPVFDKAGQNYNLAISLLEGVNISNIFNYHHQSEILMRHEVPKALKGAFVLIKRQEEQYTVMGDWNDLAVHHFSELLENSEKLFLKSLIGISEDGSAYSVISDEFTHAGVLYLNLPTHELELLIAVVEEFDELLLNIGSGLKNMFSNLLNLYPNMDLETIKDYLLSLRFPIEFKHDHKSEKIQENIRIPEWTPVKIAVLAFELLGSDLPLVVERTFVGDKTAIVCGEISVYAIKNLIDHFFPELKKSIQHVNNEKIDTEKNLLLIHPNLKEEAKRNGYSIFVLGEQKRKIRKGSPVTKAYQVADNLSLENKVIFFAERFKEIAQIYGEILYCVVADFDREHAKKQIKILKTLQGEIFEIGKKKLEREHPQLKSHLVSLEKGLIS